MKTVIYDLDDTLLSGDSEFKWAEFTVKKGFISKDLYLEKINEFDPLTGEKIRELNKIKIYANSHYVTPRPTLQQAAEGIKKELFSRLKELKKENKLLEMQRLEQRTIFDLEMMDATGSCAGIENYSRYLTGRKPGEPPPTLLSLIHI